MRYLKNKVFQRGLKNNHFDDEYIKKVLEDIFKRRSVSLGSKMYKIRASKDGQGKSGGFRNIFFLEKE
ncbi:type II toxin-antitoxin system RelE/ParE family toxin [Candidatus Omnitrophota bacterium]